MQNCLRSFSTQDFNIHWWCIKVGSWGWILFVTSTITQLFSLDRGQRSQLTYGIVLRCPSSKRKTVKLPSQPRLYVVYMPSSKCFVNNFRQENYFCCVLSCSPHTSISINRFPLAELQATHLIFLEFGCQLWSSLCLSNIVWSYIFQGILLLLLYKSWM